MNGDIRLLSFDLDGTLIGDREGTKRFREAWFNLPEKARPLLCYNTGRLLEDTLQVIRLEELPPPDYCICGVGTVVYDCHKEGVDLDFLERLRQGWDRDALGRIVASLEGAILQPEEYQNDFKSSWYLMDAEETRIEGLRKELTRAGFDVNVVYSSSRDLDILPFHATKGKALLWLLEKLSLRPDQVVVGGDTGNDRSMFLLPRVRGILVANAREELAELKGREGIFSASERAGRGIVEGLVSFRVFNSFLLEQEI